jgi:hypothetical protein
MIEADLFEPVKIYFEDRGAKVFAEVRGNDVVVEQDGLYFGLELKKNFNLELVYQLLHRRGLFHGQYAVIQITNGSFRNRSQAMMLLSALGFGLIGVEFLKTKTKVSLLLQCSRQDKPIQMHGKRRLRMISEISNRFIEYGRGGVQSGSELSSYRQRALFALWLIRKRGAIRPKDLDLCLPGKKVGSILHQNVYGWFIKIQRGTYIATDAGIMSYETYEPLIDPMIYQWEELLKQLEQT